MYVMSTYVMNLKNSYMNLFQVLAEEVTFVVCVWVVVILCPAYWGHPIFLLPAKIHSGPTFGHEASTYDLSMLLGLLDCLKKGKEWG